MKVFESEYTSIFKDKSEVVVFGEESDWIVRYANTTNPKDKWRKWFGKRELAEEFADKVSQEYYPEFIGRFDVR